MLENDGFIEFVLYGKELTSSDGPHLQTLIITTNRVRGKTLKNKLLNKKWWIEGMKGTIKQNVAYCSKDKDVTAHGTQPAEKEPGKRNDILNCRDWLKEAYRSNYELWNSDFFSLMLRYPRLERARDTLARGNRLNLAIHSDEQLRSWQSSLAHYLDGRANDRSIRFIVDESGGSGKTTFAKYTYAKCPEKTQLLTGGSFKDIAYALDESKSIFIFNIPKKGMQYLSYNILEGLKDGIVFSSKYESTMKMWSTKNHVVVLCNEQPDFDQLTLDRYDIVTI